MDTRVHHVSCANSAGVGGGESQQFTASFYCGKCDRALPSSVLCAVGDQAYCKGQRRVASVDFRELLKNDDDYLSRGTMRRLTQAGAEIIDEVCMHRETSTFKINRPHATAANIGFSIPKDLRKCFVGTPEFEARVAAVKIQKHPELERTIADSEDEDEEDEDGDGEGDEDMVNSILDPKYRGIH